MTFAELVSRIAALGNSTLDNHLHYAVEAETECDGSRAGCLGSTGETQHNADSIRELARRRYEDDDTVVPDDALVEQVGEDGYWVAARVWIPVSSLPALPTDDKTADKEDSVKTYIVYVDGIEREIIKAGSHNAAEKKAQKKHPGKQVSVSYTEV